MESCSVNVVAIPSKEAQTAARNLGRLLDGFDNYYTLSESKYIPHATIYQAQYPKKNIDNLRKTIGALCAESKPFEAVTSDYLDHHGYIWWNIEKSPEFVSVHKSVLENLNPIREGLILPHLTPSGYVTSEKFTKEEAYNVKKYGTVIVDKLFNPHFTLAKLKGFEGNIDEVLGVPRKFSFNVSELSIGEMGNHGTLLKIIDNYPLKG
jgi:2'-5' RNA ligase